MRRLWTPARVGQELGRRFRARHRAWFDAWSEEGSAKLPEAQSPLGVAVGGAREGVEEWPLRIALGAATESEVSADPVGVRMWAEEWFGCALPGRLESRARRWPRLGEQLLPTAWLLEDPHQVAHWCGQADRWARACQRKGLWTQRWPGVVKRLPGVMERAAPACFFEVLADYDDPDFARLLTALDWLLTHPASGLYLRQLPLGGVDTKWVEQRTRVIVALLAWLRGTQPVGRRGPALTPEQGREQKLKAVKTEAQGLEPEAEQGPEQGADIAATAFFEATGLRPLPHRIRLRILCADLRQPVGGLSDIEAPIEELVRLDLKPRGIVIVENQQTGVALPDLDGVVAFMRLGRSVGLLRQLPWLAGVPVWYWGDIDTHGLEILARAREIFPALRSVLMDQTTLLRYRHLTVVEPQQHGGSGLDPLDVGERELFDELRAGRWGARLRLEQERIPWDAVLDAFERIGRAVDTGRG